MKRIFDKAITEFEKKNYNEAYGLFSESADVNPNAMFNLAIMHMRGQGCQKNNAIAKDWFTKAAEHNHLQALNSLAIFYEKGMHGEVDSAKALEYYKRAADLGNVEAQLKTGMLYRDKGKNAQAMRYLIV